MELTYEQLEVRSAKLQEEQKENFNALREMIIINEGKLLTTYRDSDGWGDGFKVDYFVIETHSTVENPDREIKLFKGSDNNTGYYKRGAGWGLQGTLD